MVKKTLLALVAASSLLFASTSTASAQTRLVAGEVWQVNGEGVYVQNSNGITFVPAGGAAFYIDNIRVDHHILGVGQPIRVFTDRIIYQGQTGYGNPHQQQPRYKKQKSRSRNHGEPQRRPSRYYR